MPARDAEQLERADVRRIGVELVSRRVADHDRHRPHRRRRQPGGAPEPVGSPSARRTPRRPTRPIPPRDLVERREQHLLDGALDRAQRQRRLDRRVRPLAVVGAERADQRVRVGREALARARDGRRDRQTLLERVPQRRDLAVREQPVLARATAAASGSRIVAPTPASVFGLTFRSAAASLVLR